MFQTYYYFSLPSIPILLFYPKPVIFQRNKNNRVRIFCSKGAKECACYGYLPSRNSTRALAKEWECSFNERRTSVRTNPNKLVNAPSRHLELFAIAYASENPNARRRDGQCEQSCRWTLLTCVPTVKKVHAQAELIGKIKTNERALT